MPKDYNSCAIASVEANIMNTAVCMRDPAFLKLSVYE